MIIAYTQNNDSTIDISYVDKNKQIAIEHIVLQNGFYNYVDCDEFDPERIVGLKSFKGSFVKKEASTQFNHHNINEFFGFDIPNNYKESHERLNLLNVPNPFSFDIETDITDETGYSTPELAENKVLSISFTDFGLNTIYFSLKNGKKPINDADKGYIEGVLRASLKDYYSSYDFKYDIREFDTEYEMLSTFLDCIRQYFHLLIGWNCLTFDWLYIYNRCVKLGIDPKKASPLQQKITQKIRIKPKGEGDDDDTNFTVLTLPKHRIIIDYMKLFKESLIYSNLGSYSLDSISELILGLNKVSYEGNLRKLYEEDHPKFIAYALMDTILVMLIHKKTNLMVVDFFQSYYTGVPYMNISQNSISEALVYNELRGDGMFLLESEKIVATKRNYVGAFVKAPTKKIINSVMGVDFSGLYPNTMITMGLSPEAKVDSIKVDAEGNPINISEKAKFDKYIAMGYCITPLGRVYDVSKDFLYTRIEKKLLSQRKVFKNHMEDVYLRIIPSIEKEIEKRLKQ